MAKKLEIPLTLETGANLRGSIKDALAKSDYGVLYSNAIFRLINATCAQIKSDPPNDLQEILGDISLACEIGIALNNSIGESLLPVADLAASFETETEAKSDE